MDDKSKGTTPRPAVFKSVLRPPVSATAFPKKVVKQEVVVKEEPVFQLQKQGL